jgi:hypothetical protein
MNISAKPKPIPRPVDARVADRVLHVRLADGRTISAPIAWFPRLDDGTPAEWRNFELNYEGIHWPDLNEDISVEGLLNGEKSGESAKSIQRFLSYRARGEKEPIPELPLPPDFALALARQSKRKSRTQAKGRRSKAA